VRWILTFLDETVDQSPYDSRHREAVLGAPFPQFSVPVRGQSDGDELRVFAARQDTCQPLTWLPWRGRHFYPRARKVVTRLAVKQPGGDLLALPWRKRFEQGDEAMSRTGRELLHSLTIARASGDYRGSATPYAVTMAWGQHPLIGISARRVLARVAQSVTVLPAVACDRLTEEMGTAEQLAPLLAAVVRAVGVGTFDRSGGYGGSLAIRG
jgi:hypothetical protein